MIGWSNKKKGWGDSNPMGKGELKARAFWSTVLQSHRRTNPLSHLGKRSRGIYWSTSLVEERRQAWEIHWDVVDDSETEKGKRGDGSRICEMDRKQPTTKHSKVDSPFFRRRNGPNVPTEPSKVPSGKERSFSGVGRNEGRERFDDVWRLWRTIEIMVVMALASLAGHLLLSTLSVFFLWAGQTLLQSFRPWKDWVSSRA